MTGTLVLKLGGELLETMEQRSRVAAAVSGLAVGRPVVIVHGGGRAIDAELDRRGIVPRKVDGLRITDQPTLDAVVAVLAGTANTALVATLVSGGLQAIGLTGVDAGLGRAKRVSAYRTAAGDAADLGLVGDPESVDPSLLELLLVQGYVPVVASIGVDEEGQVVNVNADVMACRIAAAIAGSELVIAGTTAGVLDDHGQTIAALDPEAIEQLIASGTATTGMIAKLDSCRAALLDGVSSVRIIDGRWLDAGLEIDQAPGTLLAPRAVHTT